MNPTSRLEAQQRADEIRAFEGELKRLQEQGVLSLTGEQERAVTDHHATLLAQYERAFDVDVFQRHRDIIGNVKHEDMKHEEGWARIGGYA